MTVGILGKKIGMTQLFQEDGKWIPVTVVQAGPCRVLQVKAKDLAELPEGHRSANASRGKRGTNTERPRRVDGYYAVQLGFEAKPQRVCGKPELGHAGKAGAETALRFIREFRYETMPELQQGEDITVSAFQEIKRVDVTGTSKGRGWSGTIKRFGFARQRTTHGNSKAHRKLGGLGRTYSTMKGVPKGKKMPGQYGCDKVTVQNLDVIKVDEERNLLYLRGAVPGHRNGYLVIRKSVKTR